MIWLNGCNDPDTHVALRGTFEVDVACVAEIRFAGTADHIVYLDGKWIGEGPPRNIAGSIEYDSVSLRLPAGRHVVAIHAHHIGVDTRLQLKMPPGVRASIQVGGSELPVRWRGFCMTGHRPPADAKPANGLDELFPTIRNGGYHSQVTRINPELGWIDWCDTRTIPADWTHAGFDDSEWAHTTDANPNIQMTERVMLGQVQRIDHDLHPMAEGILADAYGYERDDISARFFLRDIECQLTAPEGVWRRYDLGQVRLGRPTIELDLPRGAVVEIATNELLHHGRVSPYIAYSLGYTCNMDHFVARGGRQVFSPTTAKGGRYIEVHVLADPKQVRWVSETFHERTYYADDVGAFECRDAGLESAWHLGARTLRACTEDAVADAPVRERGQWLDASSAGLAIGAATQSDLRPFRRLLVQVAECANETGMVSALAPGHRSTIPSFACHWVRGCHDYYRLTGDRQLLLDLYPRMLLNMEALSKVRDDDGWARPTGWLFIDWAYDEKHPNAHLCFNLFYLSALRAASTWAAVLGDRARQASFESEQAELKSRLAGVVESLGGSPDRWNEFGYQCAALALGQNIVPKQHESVCVDLIKRKWTSSFPYDRNAPRMPPPLEFSNDIVTPYFAHYAFPPLIERGEGDFVFDLIRKCWGWITECGITTCTEVFDSRWSRCHNWSGVPTWILSRYCLGLIPRFDLGVNHFELDLQPGSLPHANGRVPSRDFAVNITWARRGDLIEYAVQTPQPIILHQRDAGGVMISRQILGRDELLLERSPTPKSGWLLRDSHAGIGSVEPAAVFSGT